MSDHTPTTAPALGKLLTMDDEQYSLTERPDDLYGTHWIHCLHEHDRCAIAALRAELDAQRREVARLTEDRERIEWLERQGAGPFKFTLAISRQDGTPAWALFNTDVTGWGEGKSVREALDAARREDAAMRQDGEQ